MSEAVDGRAAVAGRRGRSRRAPGLIGLLVLAALLLVAPLYLQEFWLRTGFAVFGAAVGAIGLNLLVGTAGQLSLAHAFFLAVGATTYTFVSGTTGVGAEKSSGLGLPPLLGMVAGVLAAGVAGLLFAPISARLRGIYLGIASLGLVFIGEHLLNTWTQVTGGFNGRSTPPFSLFGFSFTDSNPYLSVLNVPFGQAERLWYLGAVLLGASYWYAANLLRGRPGRALLTLRDSEVAAAVMGVNVKGYKARVFLVSSMYAGLSGVLYALSIGSIAPESFGLTVSVQFLAMIVLGGLGSVAGAVIGAAFVSATPLIFQQYAGTLPLVAAPGEGGITAGQAAAFLYGGAVVLIVMFEPTGLVGLARRLTRRRPAGGSRGEHPPSFHPDPTLSPAPADNPTKEPTR